MAMLRIACVQLCPGNDMDANLRAIRARVDEAAAAGAQLVMLPEFAAFLDRSGRAMAQAAAGMHAHPALRALQDCAREHAVWLLAGSLTVRLDPPSEKLANRGILLDDAGRIAAQYDKVHLFDARLPDGREIAESRAYQAGAHAALAETPWGPVGLSICYDLRFPALYRALAQAGAVLLCVPSAFALETGGAHWHALLRARAIENGCYVAAAATCGEHPGRWHTYGHSLVVDPWGAVAAEAGDAPGILLCDLDLDAAARTRACLPSLAHDRPFQVRRFSFPTP
ncbi:carbon-nitrogen hydrolase family protein [Bordetella petrii]|uniref:carbon-nitrogen hydrolase family protein n=1 Tax=Bordetella petrii TaxID=94624 RepID=UPI001A9598C1|nr:carbon-nitrogen hydrolase family protein [Bordetella petrii]MBO1114587.1 carbon-nitrogen hydrolase family protein [Bordetella petrii]